MNNRQRKWFKKHYELCVEYEEMYHIKGGVHFADWKERSSERWWNILYVNDFFTDSEFISINRFNYLWRFRKQKPKYRKLRRNK